MANIVQQRDRARRPGPRFCPQQVIQLGRPRPNIGTLNWRLVTLRRAEGDIADFKDQTASLRFTLRNGQFYSYWME